jgi:hypothetical protein
VVARMSIFAVRLGFAFVVAALCLGGRPAHAQSAYWTPGWLGFGGNLNAGQDANNFPTGWFVGGERGGMGLSMPGIIQAGAFGSLYSEGVQYGYNFKNAPVTVYAGFDTLKYNSGIGSPFSPFDSTSRTVPGYGMHAGVEFKPTSNLSLSLGFSYTQQSGRIDSDTTSPSLSNASQYDLVGGRR